MKKILFLGFSIVVLYSILVYAYGFDCAGPLNQSTYYKLDSGVTPTESCTYCVGCALDDVSPAVKIVVTDLNTSEDVLNLLDYNVKNSNHYFDAVYPHSYSVFVSSESTTGWALCEPAN